MKHRRFEIINHGWHHCDEFLRPKIAEFDDVVTGAGSDAVEAYHIAVDRVYQSCNAPEQLDLPTRPRGYGINQRAIVPHAAPLGAYWYVSIRYKEPKGAR